MIEIHSSESMGDCLLVWIMGQYTKQVTVKLYTLKWLWRNICFQCCFFD